MSVSARFGQQILLESGNATTGEYVDTTDYRQAAFFVYATGVGANTELVLFAPAPRTFPAGSEDFEFYREAITGEGQHDVLLLETPVPKLKAAIEGDGTAWVGVYLQT